MFYFVPLSLHLSHGFSFYTLLSQPFLFIFPLLSLFSFALSRSISLDSVLPCRSVCSSVFLDSSFLSDMFFLAVVFFSLSLSVLTFCPFPITFSIPTFPGLLCPVLLSSPLLATCPPIHRQRLISVWHFVIFPSYLITHIHTREKNLSGILILDV